jgi:ABC-2 type transport system permease protein
MDRTHSRIRRFRALIIKEFYQIIRDPSSIILSIVMPLFLLFLYGYGVSLTLNHLYIGLVLEDTSPDAQSFAQALTDSRYFEVNISRNRKDFIDDIISGKLSGMVVVPSYFSEFRLRQDYVAPIQVIADGSDPNTATFLQNYVRGALEDWKQHNQISYHAPPGSLIKAQPRYWFNPQLESQYFLMPGSIAIILTLVGTLLTALVVAREWERGTMEALMSTPVTNSELLVGKLIPYFFLGMVSLLLCLIFTVFLFQVPFRGSLLVLIIVSSIFLFSALLLGLYISTVARNQFVAAQAAMVVAFLPAIMLSGFVFEISTMPLPIRMLTYLFPVSYFVPCLQTLFLVGNVWKLLAVNSFCMLLLTALLFIATARKTVKRLD